jgi:hypothetical protein
MLNTRAKLQKPVKIGLIGAGKFGSMILSQARHIEGLIISAVADVNVEKAKESFNRVGWDTSNCFATSINDAIVSGKTWITENAADVCKIPEIECVIEATGDPLFGVRHALMAIENAKHVIMVNVEADVLCGPYLNQKAIEITNFPIKAESIGMLINMIDDGIITHSLASQKLFPEMLKYPRENPNSIAEKNQWINQQNENNLEVLIKEILDKNPQEKERFKNGEKKLIGFFIGKIMMKEKLVMLHMQRLISNLNLMRLNPVR